MVKRNQRRTSLRRRLTTKNLQRKRGGRGGRVGSGTRKGPGCAKKSGLVETALAPLGLWAIQYLSSKKTKKKMYKKRKKNSRF